MKDFTVVPHDNWELAKERILAVEKMFHERVGIKCTFNITYINGRKTYCNHIDNGGFCSVLECPLLKEKKD